MFRYGRRGSALLVALVVGAFVAPTTTLAAIGTPVSADLEGTVIPLRDVNKYHCHDLDYPRIHCFRSEVTRDASARTLLATAGTAYVIVWENPSFQGASLIISQDYTALVTLFWNDRISSFKVQNSQSGRFWTDWFYGGTFYAFCCNQQVPLLGAYNDTFSSVYRT
jgi:hypothetical protein